MMITHLMMSLGSECLVIFNIDETCVSIDSSTSRGNMGKVLEFDYMYLDKCCATVEIQGGTAKVTKTYTDVVMLLPFGEVLETSDADRIQRFFEYRCFPKSRANCRELVDELGFGNIGFDAKTIALSQHGYMCDDCFWLRFPEERGKLTYEGLKKMLGVS